MTKYLLILFLLISCTDYIVTNPKHPEEYIGVWNNDSIYVDGKKVNYTISPNIFGIYQESIEVGQDEYPNWEVDKTTNPPKFIAYSYPPYTPLRTWNIIKTPAQGKMEIEENTTIYYLHKVR